MSEFIWTSILHKIKRVPTPENSQAWSFRCHLNDMEIYWKADVGKHFFDVNNHAACISLGCLLEYIEVAADSLKYKIEFKNFNHQAFNGNGPVATLSLQSIPQAKIDLEPILSTRATNRGLFKKGKLPHFLAQELNVLRQEFSGLQISLENNLSPHFVQDLSKLEAAFYAYPEYLRDLLHNIIFSSKQSQELKTGIFHKELSLFILQKLPLFLAKKFPILQKLLPALGLKYFVRAHNKKLLESSQLLILGAIEPTHQSLIEVGRAGTKAWLLFNKHGLAVQPMTALGLQIYEYNTDQLPAYISEKHRKYLKAVSQDYAEELKMPYPTWVLRYGQPLTSPKPSTGLSLRNDLVLED